MSEQGWREAVAAGLTRVVDLRNADEVGRGPHHPVVDEALLSGIEVVAAPTDAPEDPEFVARCVPWLDHPLSWAANAELCPQAFGDIFAAIADFPGAVLMQCAGGRDRTAHDRLDAALGRGGPPTRPSRATNAATAEPRSLPGWVGVRPGARAVGADRLDRGAHRGWAGRPAGRRRPALLDGTDVASYLRGVGLSEDQVARLGRVLLD